MVGIKKNPCDGELLFLGWTIFPLFHGMTEETVFSLNGSKDFAGRNHPHHLVMEFLFDGFEFNIQFVALYQSLTANLVVVRVFA